MLPLARAGLSTEETNTNITVVRLLQNNCHFWECIFLFGSGLLCVDARLTSAEHFLVEVRAVL